MCWRFAAALIECLRFKSVDSSGRSKCELQMNGMVKELIRPGLELARVDFLDLDLELGYLD